MRNCLRLAFGAVIFLAGYSPTLGQQAGLLLGHGRLAGDSFQYQTLWITFSPTEARVSATVPDLIVPRSTGFLRIGLTIACEYIPDAGQDSSRDFIWQTPIEKAPVIRQGPPCKNHAPGDVRDSEGEENNGSSDDAGIRLCSRQSGQIRFVSPTHISEEFNSVDTCDERGGRDLTSNDVRFLDDAKAISLADLLGAGATKSYETATAKGFAEVSKEMNCPDPTGSDYDLTSWKIRRSRGAWRPFTAVDLFPGDCAISYPMSLSLPKTVTGEAARPEVWKAFAAAVPNVSDLFVSPLGDYAVVLVSPKQFEYHLYAYSVQNGAPGKRLAELPWENSNSYPIVMDQWCSGKYVPQWGAVVQKIEEHPLPAPVFAAEATAPAKTTP